MLNRMYELAEQSANGTFEDEHRPQASFRRKSLSSSAEIDRIADSANFNGINLLDGSMEDGADHHTYGYWNCWRQGCHQRDQSEVGCNFPAGRQLEDWRQDIYF